MATLNSWFSNVCLHLSAVCLFICLFISCLFTFSNFQTKHWFLQSLLPRKTLDFQHFVYICQLFIYQLFVYFFVSWLFALSAVCLLFRMFKQNIEKSWLFCQNGDFKFLFTFSAVCLQFSAVCLQFFSADNVNKNVNKQLKFTSLNSTFWQKSREISMFLLQIQKVNKQLIVYIFKNLNFRAKT